MLYVEDLYSIHMQTADNILLRVSKKTCPYYVKEIANKICLFKQFGVVLQHLRNGHNNTSFANLLVARAQKTEQQKKRMK